MELLTRNVHLNRKKGKIVTQTTLENDFIVSDINPDVEEIVTNNTQVRIDGMKIIKGKADISGRLCIQILYIPLDDKSVPTSMDLEIPFDEPVSMEMLEDGDTVRVDYQVDDVKLKIINSRKISVRAIVTFELEAEMIYDMSIGIEPESESDAEYIKKQLKIMQIFTKKGDVFRIKDEVELPKGKPNIGKLIWKSIDIRNCQTKLLENSISIKGEIGVFVIYTPDDENLPTQWIDSVIHFGGVVDCDGCNEEMIHDIIVTPMEVNADIKPDYDGEERILEIDAVLGLDIRMYEEDSIDVLMDIYSPSKELIAERERAVGEKIVLKNNSKCRVNERINVKSDKSPILQICNTSGKVSIDSSRIVEDGIMIEGAVEVTVIYISGNDKRPFCGEKSLIPFSYTADVKGIDDTMTYTIKEGIEQISSMMTSENEVEIKAVIAMDISVCKPVDESVITKITEEKLDMKKINEMPGIIIYKTSENDNLWSIAKEYHTTVSSLKEINGIHGDNINSGDSIMIVKGSNNY